MRFVSGCRCCHIAKDAAEVYDRADMILKVKEPLFNEQFNTHEIDMLRENQVLITFIHPAAPSNHDNVKRLQNKQFTAFTMDGIPRISRAQRMDPLTSMSAITGYKAIIIAAAKFPKFIPMIGTAIGTIKPATFPGHRRWCGRPAGHCHRQAARCRGQGPRYP
jgi:H+-translocating NAD(P) transhydrogenase subunit alpha